MKKTVFPLVMAALAACPVLFSCTEKEQEVPVENKLYEYRFELAGDDTRALLNDNGVFWEAGDHVGLFTPAGSLQAVVNTAASPKTIDVQSSTPLADGTTVYAYYPYVEDNTNASASKVLFRAEQTGGSVSAMPLAGIPATVSIQEGASTVGSVRFLNLGSIIDFRIFSSTYAGETVESVTLQAGENSNIAGTATIDLTAVSWNDEKETATIPSLTWAEGAGTTTVTLTQSAPVAASKEAAISGGNLYMVVAPGTYSGTITVTTNAARYTFPFTNKELVLNGLKRFNMNLDNATEREGFSKTYVYAATISVGTYVIGGSESSGELSVALFPTVESKSWNSSQGVVSGEVVPHKVLEGLSNTAATITTEDADIIGAEVTLSASGNGWKIKVNKTGEYLIVPSSNYVIDLTTEESEATSFTVSSNSIRSGSYYFYHSGSAKGFTFRNQNTTNLRFYKLDGRSLSQTLAFSETEFNYDLASGDPFVEPTLTGAKTTVIYGTSNPDIAAVDAISGEVTFNENHRTGTVTITATAAGMDGYASAEASYTITVTDSNKPVVTYYKASVLESGYEYLIVSAGHALKNDNGSLEDEEVTVSDNTIALAEDAGLLWMATAVSGNNYGTHTLSNGSVYLSRSGSGSNATLEGGTNGSGNYVAWRYNGEALWNGSSTNYYANYNEGGWKASTSQPDNIQTELFTARPPQTLNFSSATAEYDLYSNAWTIAAPTLSGAETTVTYGSSDETVATVDADGSVHPLSVGTTTITATAAGSAEYQGASATYTLTVTNSDPNKLYYNKITSLEDIEDEAVYLIVRENGSKAFKPVREGSNFVSGNAQNAVDVTIKSGKIEAKETVEPCQIVLKKDSGSNYYIMVPQAEGSYLYLVPTRSGSGWYTYSFAAQSTPMSTSISWNSTNSAFNITYFSYNTSGYFQAASSSSSLALYMLEDPRAEQDLAFGAEEAVYDLGTSTWTKAVPTLTGTPQGDVTYSSSDETVATVTNAGVVTPLKKGTTTITAHASGNDSYKPAQASYELTVVNSSEVPSIYTKVTSADDLEEGAKYLVVYESDSKVFKPILNGSSFETAMGNAIDVSISDNEISSADLADCELTLESGYYLFVGAANRYLYVTYGSIGAEENKGSSHSLSVSISNGTASISRTSNNQTYYLRYSASNSYFQSSTSTANVALYKLDDGQPKAQHLAFSESEMEYNMAFSSEFVEPTLSGVKTTVSYTSDNTAVATVNASTGEVSIQGVGEANITATAAATEQYLEGSASYKIVVTNQVQYYTKINSRDDLPGASQTSATGDYLFVYESGSKAYVFKAICNGTPTGAGNTNSGHVELTKEGSAIEVDLTSDGILATDVVRACTIQLAHHTTPTRNDWTIKPASLGTYWVRVYNDGSSVKILAMTSAGYSSTFTFEGTGNNLEIKRTDSSRTAYWSYNTTDNCFEATATASKISIYKLSE